MEFTDSSDPNAVYQVVEPLFFNDDVIGVLDGKHILGRVNRSSVTAFRVEQRSSFKHPVMGFVLGLVMIGIPLLPPAFEPDGLKYFTRASKEWLFVCFFLLCIGGYLIWCAASRRDQPWLVFETGSSEFAYPLRQTLPQRAEEVLRSLIRSRK